MIHVITEDEKFVKRIEDAADFTLRRVPPSTRQGIIAKHSKIKTGKTDGRDYTENDWAGILDDILDYVILDWNDEVCDISGAKVPCVRANKLALPEVIKTAIADECAGATVGNEALKKT